MNSAVPQLLYIRRVLRLVWFVLGVSLLFRLFWLNLPPNGKIHVTARTNESNGYLGGFTPLDRAKPVKEGGLWYSDVVSEPAYLHVAAPSLYERFRVRLRYKLEGQPYVALGVRTDISGWNFDMKPIDLPMLDASDWNARQDGSMRIYERQASARSARDILTTGTRVAVLGAEPVRWGLKLPKRSNEKMLEIPLHETGSRSIYVYVQDGAFEMSLGLRGSEKAAARVSLVREGKTLLSREHRGDGAVALILSGAEPGLYRVDLQAPSDVSLIALATRHSRLALIDTAGEHLHIPAGAVAFDPEFPVVTWESDLAQAPYDTIIADYRPPRIDADGWRTSEAQFDFSSAAVSHGRVQTILSLPAIRTSGGKMRIDRVEIDYERPPIDPEKLLDVLKRSL